MTIWGGRGMNNLSPEKDILGGECGLVQVDVREDSFLDFPELKEDT